MPDPGCQEPLWEQRATRPAHSESFGVETGAGRPAANLVAPVVLAGALRKAR